MIPSVGTSEHTVIEHEMNTTSNTVIIVEPSSFDGNQGATEELDECDGSGVDTVDFVQISGSCYSCSVPINQRRITQCLKESYYSYYVKRNEVSWSKEDLVCDSLSILNMDNAMDQMVSDGAGDGVIGKHEHNVMVNGQSVICRDRFEMRFMFDLTSKHASYGDVKEQFEQLVGESSTGMSEEDAMKDLALSMMQCNKEFVGIDCEIPSVEMIALKLANAGSTISCRLALSICGVWVLRTLFI